MFVTPRNYTTEYEFLGKRLLAMGVKTGWAFLWMYSVNVKYTLIRILLYQEVGI